MPLPRLQKKWLEAPFNGGSQRGINDWATAVASAIDVETMAAEMCSRYFLPDVPDDFDPSMSGLYGHLGAMVSRAGGSQAWIKIGLLNTSWIPIYGGEG